MTSDGASGPMREASAECERLAEELDKAAAHLRIAAGHMREGLVPRYTAHIFAGQGHIVNATDGIRELARVHASKSNLA